MEKPEKRTGRRVPIVARIEAQARGAPFIALAQNISLNGMLIRTTDPIPENEVVHLKFLLPDSHREIRVSGTVQYVSPGEFMGVRFNDLKPADGEAIKQFVETI